MIATNHATREHLLSSHGERLARNLDGAKERPRYLAQVGVTLKALTFAGVAAARLDIPHIIQVAGPTNRPSIIFIYSIPGIQYAYIYAYS